MATHKFAVGQTLHFSPGLGGDNKRQGRYKVVRQVPETGGIFQYRIKSEMDGHERVVREDQVERENLRLERKPLRTFGISVIAAYVKV